MSLESILCDTSLAISETFNIFDVNHALVMLYAIAIIPNIYWTPFEISMLLSAFNIVTFNSYVIKNGEL